jgi:predicted  nucleic acid-binding Zn-ribbon protein
MTTNELDRLIAMLEPNAEADAIDFVRRALTEACVPFTPSLDAEINVESQSTTERSEQQSTDPFNEWLPNDPRYW